MHVHQDAQHPGCEEQGDLEGGAGQQQHDHDRGRRADGPPRHQRFTAPAPHRQHAGKSEADEPASPVTGHQVPEPLRPEPQVAHGIGRHHQGRAQQPVEDALGPLGRQHGRVQAGVDGRRREGVQEPRTQAQHEYRRREQRLAARDWEEQRRRAGGLPGLSAQSEPPDQLAGGLVQPAGRTRSRAKAVDQLYAFAAGYSCIEELAVEHTGPGLLLVGILGDKAKAQSAG